MSPLTPGNAAEAGTPFSRMLPGLSGGTAALPAGSTARAFSGHGMRQPGSAGTSGSSGTGSPCRASSQASTAVSAAGDGSPSAPSASRAAAPSASAAPAPPCASGTSSFGRPRAATACQ